MRTVVAFGGEHRELKHLASDCAFQNVDGLKCEGLGPQ